MATPPLFLLGALSLGGWQTEWLPIGVALGALVESSRLVRARWSFSQQDLNRIWDLCTVLFLTGLVVALASDEGRGAFTGIFGHPGGRPAALNQAAATMLRFVTWLPLVFLPIVVAQVFSHQGRFEWSTFSWWLRKQRTRQKAAWGAGSVNVTYPYAAACLLAASATHQHPIGFFVSFFLLLAWGLWAQRPVGYSTVNWALLMGLVAALGFGAQAGMKRLQMWAENLNVSWLQRSSTRGFDQKAIRTAIGQIGKLKLSGRIVLRLETDGQPPPDLLREASYNVFRSPTWEASYDAFRSPTSLNTNRAAIPVTSRNENSVWKLLPDKESRRAFRSSHYLRGGIVLLPLPSGVSTIEQLPVEEMEQTPLGVVRVSESPGLVSYVVRHDLGVTIDAPPEAEDRDIPPAEEPALGQIAEELKLKSLSPRQALETVRRFFAEHFSYSTYLTSQDRAASNETALATFLLHRRSGHCEFFATATTLLLRKAGIPARYAVGYSVQEGRGKRFAVRERHAHAWCLAHIDGTWQDVDNTPASWNAIEEKHASWWEWVSDAGSRLWFEFQKVRWGHSPIRKYLVWVPLPLLLWLAARLYWNKGWKRFNPAGAIGPKGVAHAGLDSEFFAIERLLRERGLERDIGETLSSWLKRAAPHLAELASKMPELLRLHYRYRFDPMGLTRSERETLKSKATAWLHLYQAKQRRAGFGQGPAAALKK